MEKVVLLIAAVTMCCFGTLMDEPTKFENYPDAWMTDPRRMYDLAQYTVQTTRLAKRDEMDHLKIRRRSTGENSGSVPPPPPSAEKLKCPSSHPFVYNDGQHCCASNKEKKYTPQGAKCDGSEITRESLCCEGDEYVKCPSGNCQSNEGVNYTLTTGVNYTLTYSIRNSYWSGSKNAQYVTIKGDMGETEELQCKANFNVRGQDVTCVVRSDVDIGSYKCLHLRGGGGDGLAVLKVIVKINGVLTHTILPKNNRQYFELDTDNIAQHEFCRRMWISGGQCGPKFPLEGGAPSQCNPEDPDGYRCCSPGGWCGKTPAHCTCDGCIDYGQIPMKLRVIENPQRWKKYSLTKELELGDYLEIEATYGGPGDNENFYFNLIDGDNNWLFHCSVRQSIWTTVFNSHIRWWGSEVRVELPSLARNEDFVIRIVVMDNGYEVRFNGKALTKTFHYVKPFSTVKSVYLSGGGNNGFKWNKIILPGNEKDERYFQVKALKEDLKQMEMEIKPNVVGKTHQEIKAYANTTEGSLAIFKMQLYKKLIGRNEVFPPNLENLDYILSNREVLEMFLTSGDIFDDRYPEALVILDELITMDPKVKEEPLRLKLAVATALTHSTRVWSMAHGYILDYKIMYQSFLKSNEEGKLFPIFSNLTAWHLRYVIDTWQTPEEHEWARENTPAEYKSSSEIGNVWMVPYVDTNDDNITVTSNKYYYYYPGTLKVVSLLGGVCGAVSKVAAAMCNSFGVPAMPVSQPGHAAYMWYKDGVWELGNSMTGWGESKAHKGIQYTWLSPSYYILLMEEAQRNLEGYRLSEKMRIASKLAKPEDRFVILEDAIRVCPHNFACWIDLKAAILQPDLDKDTLLSALLPSVVASREQPEDSKEIVDLARDNVPTGGYFTQPFRMTNTGNAGSYCRYNKGAFFVVDLKRPSKITEIRFKWWGQAQPKKIRISAMSAEGGKFTEVLTEADKNTTKSSWHFAYFPGWDMKTTKIRVGLEDGRKSEWDESVWIGIRKFNAYGYHLDVEEDASKNRPTTANTGSTDPASLVDANSTTIWNGNSENSWFEIDLQRICVLNDVEFLWDDGAKPEELKVSYKVGNGEKTEFSAIDSFEEVDLNRGYGTKLRVEMTNGTQALKGVKVCGIVYSTKRALKEKVNEQFEENHYYVGKYLRDEIEKMEYEN